MNPHQLLPNPPLGTLELFKPEHVESATPQPPSARIGSQKFALPAISGFLLAWFTWYSRRYVAKHFHSLRVSLAGLPPKVSDLPLVLYCNHASWWDPLIGLLLKQTYFAERQAYAPIDAEALKKYKFLGKIGMFGVQKGSLRGASHFLRTAEAVLDSPANLLIITPQSRFADVRERPVRFESGLGHLAARIPKAIFLPLAVELVFWEERLPEILVRFGKPIIASSENLDMRKSALWSGLLEHALQVTQEQLAAESLERDPRKFQHLLSGKAGQGGVYDLWRWLKARCKGEQFNLAHGKK